jgi:hypothetical protein
MAFSSTFSELALAEAAKLRREIVQISADVKQANAEIDAKLKAWQAVIGNVGVPVRWSGDRIQIQDPDGTWLTGPALTGPAGHGLQGIPGERGPAGPVGSAGPQGPKGTTYMPTSTMATIASGQSLSGIVDLQDSRATGIILPAAWTTAAITYQVSADNITYINLYDAAGAEISTAAAASRAVNLDPAAFLGWRYLKLRSGTAALAVNQAASRDIWVVGL